MKEIRLSLGRTVQLVQYQDSVRYDVTVTTTREEGESKVDFFARAAQDTKAAYQQVEKAMLEAGMEAVEDVVGEKFAPEALDPKFSPPGAAAKRTRRKATGSKRRRME
jgi:hypothetical protein